MPSMQSRTQRAITHAALRSIGLSSSPALSSRVGQKLLLLIAFTPAFAPASAQSMQASSGSTSAQASYHGPVTITAGGTYSGNVTSDDPSRAAVTIDTDQPVVIINSTIEGRGNLIEIANVGRGANVTIRNTTGTALDPQVRGRLRGSFVVANNVSSLVVSNTSMYGVSFGVKVLSSKVGTLKIVNNFAQNMEDRESDGNGRLLNTRPDLGHFVIFNGVSAPNGAEIGWNQVVDTIGSSSTEDVINIYKSQGSNSAPIEAHDNYMEGFSSTTTPSYSGSGLITDGDGGSPVTAFVLFDNNEIVHTAGSGVEVASGHDVTARANRVVSCGQNTGGDWFAMSFVNAEVMWNYAGSSEFYNNTIDSTSGGMVRPNTDSAPMIADSWVYLPDLINNNSITNESFSDPCFVNGQIDLNAEDAERSAWASKVASAGVLIGDQHSAL